MLVLIVVAVADCEELCVLCWSLVLMLPSTAVCDRSVWSAKAGPITPIAVKVAAITLRNTDVLILRKNHSLYCIYGVLVFHLGDFNVRFSWLGNLVRNFQDSLNNNDIYLLADQIVLSDSIIIPLRNFTNITIIENV